MSVTVKTDIESMCNATGIDRMPNIINQVINHLIDMIRNCDGQCLLPGNIVVSVTDEDVTFYFIRIDEPLIKEHINKMMSYLENNIRGIEIKDNVIHYRSDVYEFGHYVVNIPLENTESINEVNIHVVFNDMINPNLLEGLTMDDIKTVDRILNNAYILFPKK